MCDSRIGGTGLILLAAGGSRRLGTPKQLLRDPHGRSLIQRAAHAALESACRPIAVVLGASAEEVRAELEGLAVKIVLNPDWPTGLASSLKAGLAALTEEAPLDAVIVMLCDQPGVTGTLLDTLIASYQASHHQIVACEYGETLGVPVLFSQSLFGELSSLAGDEGARRVIRKYSGPVTRIPFSAGSLDIDTPQDAAWLSAS